MEVTFESVEEWGGELRVLPTRLKPYFVQSEARKRVIVYIRGLLSEVKRKNGWQLAEQAGETTPDGMQRLLNGVVWNADAVRDELQQYIIENVGEADRILVVDETGFLKQGKYSAGVKRQYSGTGRQLSDRCIFGLCQQSRSCLVRPRLIFTKRVGRR